MQEKGLRTTDKGVYFWGSVYSNWFKVDIEIDGVKYNCTEQYMMAEKARLANDNDSLALILATNDPGKQKLYGRKVKNLDRAMWDLVKFDVVYKACLVKFSLPELKKVILETGNRVIVEASPTDKEWGVALHFNDPAVENESNWKGKNLLGKVLMKVRQELMLRDEFAK